MPLINPPTNPTWQTLTPAAKFTTVQTVQVTKWDGIVFMRGVVKELNTSGIVPLDTVLTLPVGFRPTQNISGLAVDPAGAWGARLDVSTGGLIQIFWDTARGYAGFGGNTCFVNFANVMFPTW